MTRIWVHLHILTVFMSAYCTKYVDTYPGGRKCIYNWKHISRYHSTKKHWFPQWPARSLQETQMQDIMTMALYRWITWVWLQWEVRAATAIRASKITSGAFFLKPNIKCFFYTQSNQIIGQHLANDVQASLAQHWSTPFRSTAGTKLFDSSLYFNRKSINLSYSTIQNSPTCTQTWIYEWVFFKHLRLFPPKLW